MAQALGVAVEAQPQVQMRIAVADEEPAVYRSARQRLLRQGLDRLDQQAVHVRGAGVDFGVEPF